MGAAAGPLSRDPAAASPGVGAGLGGETADEARSDEESDLYLFIAGGEPIGPCCHGGYCVDWGRSSSSAVVGSRGGRHGGGHVHTTMRCVLRLLPKADERRVRSLCLPALGTGVGEVSMDLSSKLILEALATFAEFEPARVRSVEVVLRDGAALAAWENGLRLM